MTNSYPLLYTAFYHAGRKKSIVTITLNTKRGQLYTQFAVNHTIKSFTEVNVSIVYRVDYCFSFTSTDITTISNLQSVSSLMTASYTVTSSLEMIELFYSKICIHSACGQIHGLCASIPVNVTFYI